MQDTLIMCGILRRIHIPGRFVLVPCQRDAGHVGPHVGQFLSTVVEWHEEREPKRTTDPAVLRERAGYAAD
jgi:hypothetical protein